jgi:glycosyltransferase involved in cell wall biosynthesis
MAKVSAIVSAYYAEPFIEGRLANLLEQDPQPEVIVICQTGSAEHQAAMKHECVIVETEDIPTIYRAWNMGIAAATGKYLTNANSDDRLYPGALKRCADILDANLGHDVVYFNVDIVEEIGGEAVQRFEWNEGDFDVLLRGCFVGPMPVWRRSLHATFGGFDEEMHVAGDYEFWLRIAARRRKFYHLREVWGAYTRRKGSAEHRESIRTTWETARARSRYRKSN